MSDELTHEIVEQEFKGVVEVASRLPNNTEGREVKRPVEIVEDLAHDSMERPADR